MTTIWCVGAPHDQRTARVTRGGQYVVEEDDLPLVAEEVVAAEHPGCGTGGIGLWPARALSACLAGIHLSATAIQHATARTTAFVPADRASFRIDDLTATGLPDGCAHAVV